MIVHRKVATVPMGNVTEVVGEVKLARVGVPEMMLHAPVPTIGTLAVMVNAGGAHNLWSEPALT